jgi:hypothetical protein
MKARIPSQELETYAWCDDGKARLVPIKALAAIGLKAREAWLDTFLPRFGAVLVHNSVAGRPTYLPPTAHVARDWTLSLGAIRKHLMERRGHLVLRDAGALNHYLVDFAASVARCKQCAATEAASEEQLALL